MAYTLKGIEPDQNPQLAEIEKRTGPSNFFRAMAHRPEAMTEFAKFYRTTMGPGELERRIKEMVYLASSFVNECAYCSAHHEKSAAEAGLSSAEIHGIKTENDTAFSEKERAALHYARELTRTGSADGEIRDRVFHNFSEAQSIELTMTICLANFTNRFNNGLAVPLEK